MTAADSLTVAQVDALFFMWRSGLHRTQSGWRSERFPRIPSITTQTIESLRRAGLCKLVERIDDNEQPYLIAYITEKGRKAYGAVVKARTELASRRPSARADLQKSSPKNSNDIGA